MLDPDKLGLDALPSALSLPRWSWPKGAAPLDVTIRPPGSKSLTNRALLLALLTRGSSVLRHALTEADDARRMLAAVDQLGGAVEYWDDASLTIQGCAGTLKVDPKNDVVDLNNAGTATRFLSAACLLADAPVTITGNERMRQRPIGELAAMLTKLGARVESLEGAGCPPIRITPPETSPGGSVLEIEPTQSSQFISALMLVAPALEGGLTLSLPRGITSASYVQMTVMLLDQLGVRVQHDGELRHVRVSGPIEPFDLEIEPDASGATYWWAAGALLPGSTVRVQGLTLGETDPIQGDTAFPEVLEQMGCSILIHNGSTACRGTDDLRPIMVDMRSMPDAVMSLGAVASFAKGTTIVRGVKTLRVKECDRIRAMHNELGKIGVRVEENLNGDEDTLSITPPERGVDCSDSAPTVAFDTYDDHRMAMSLSLIALRRPNTVVNDPKCVAKTYPGYWKDFAKLFPASR